MLDIKNIIEKNSIKVYFQVIISPIDNLFFSVESFIRGINPDTGELIPPTILFKEAYNQNLTSELDKACINQIFKTFKPISLLNPRIMLHINISKSFIPEACESQFLLQCSKNIDLNPKRIVIDINNIGLDTESIERTTMFIKSHREAGFYISIDDIGHDYSNIDKMIYYNPDIIKINHQMLNNLSNEYYKNKIIITITKIAHEMGILVISTGIETKDHLIDAVKSGAQLLQGFYLSPSKELTYLDMIQITESFDKDLVHRILSEEQVIDDKNVILNVVRFNTDLKSRIEDFDISQVYTYAKTIMTQYPFLESGYLLNSKGIQISNTFINKDSFGNRNKELFGMYDVGFDHSDEELFFRLDSPILTDWTIKPFRSRLTNAICVTGSFKVGPKDKPYIVVVTYDYIQFEAYLNNQEQVKHSPIIS